MVKPRTSSLSIDIYLIIRLIFFFSIFSLLLALVSQPNTSYLLVRFAIFEVLNKRMKLKKKLFYFVKCKKEDNLNARMNSQL